ncbi:pentatricopeptide repeat-containing protein At2g30100, chloroplastic isoform X2 [Lolium perenne]|uniref:pentatricopeptide repeat-containing protein At2g30100, chloroplastic isoform X2 n=1 Tax=Lolium perenne TaxID=4522 RepID=UPI0021F56D17|nr:pentatricopeptide repeat-containing protein At2g30100, chloroplastic-like isoform X2 [Lolium perenne]XP_051208269.1 pentatricopeptide repeat-containing protein At2g30100, chloroplastic-like isoform X2 [Lolium perenne]
MELMTAIACGWIKRLVGGGGDVSALLGEMNCVSLRPGLSLVEKAVALYWDRSERARAVEFVRNMLRRGSVGAGADYDGQTGGPVGYLAWKMMVQFLLLRKCLYLT